MPQIVRCSGCEYVLYDSDILKSPDDILRMYDGRCPKCNKKLGFKRDGVNIYTGSERYPDRYDKDGNYIPMRRGERS